ncbi:MAG: tRNA (adenosine(37)-N6)-threonylcarbamoyltransferase complex dimerization subunit type 1 TsaB [Elusimicrobiaceae bacterium]|nr:tRNA (adenosine(37)-N6)-threonylcarbamoyltransferase complex dimerization subunit type 1 TsaB [Elusimicrobiaceae bacterium]
MQNKRKITLGLDSSAQTLMVCLNDGEKTYSFHHTGIKQEQFLLPLVTRALNKINAKLSDISKVFFVRGPGRFTGIRISLTFASMLKELNAAEVGSATLFDIIRRQAEESRAFLSWKKNHENGILAVVLHAFRDEYFLQFFDTTQQGPVWLSKEELLQKLSARTEPLYCAGLDKDASPLSELLGNKYRLAPMADCRVRPQTLMEMAQNPFYDKNALEPLYLKPARFELGR